MTGPVAVPGYDATISSGETTLKTLQLTRVAEPGEDRKAFLSAFADELFARLIALPPNKWTEMIGHVDRFRSQRLLLAWFKDPEDQAMAAATGFDGAVRQDPGDFLYPVDANVTPASKINAIATRSLHLDVSLDDVGNALNTLEVSWDNPIDTPAGAPIRELPTLEDLRILGTYFRLLVPERSRVEEVSGGTLDELTGPAIVDEEAGRAVIGTYLMIPPGEGGLRYVWTSPYVVETAGSGRRYRLTIQKQPGLLPGPTLGDRPTADGRTDRLGKRGRDQSREHCDLRRLPSIEISSSTSASSRSTLDSTLQYRTYTADPPWNSDSSSGVLRSRWWLLLASVLITGAAAFLVSSSLPKVYEGRVTLLVGQSVQSIEPGHQSTARQSAAVPDVRGAGARRPPAPGV